MVYSEKEATPLRIGVIGCGCIGCEHLRNLHLVEGARVTAIADPHHASLLTASAILSTQGRVICGRSTDGANDVEAFASSSALLASPRIDAVIVCTPNDDHRAMLRAVAASGKHCLVEKPLCIDVAGCAEAEELAAEAAAIAHAAGRAAPIFWCGMEYRYVPTIARLIEEAESGVVGALRMLSIREHRFPFLHKVSNWNRFSARTGGTLVEKCCHFFDLMRRILRDEPRSIVAAGGQDANHLIEGEQGPRADVLDNAYVLVEFRRGARACLELCMFAEASKHQEEISLVGSCGKLEAFAPSHGTRTDEACLINFRRGVRSAALSAPNWHSAEPPAPDECGTLLEEHVAIEARLLQAGNHAGATYVSRSRFT